jgi:ligand-binding sensor domain-containing protein
VWDRISVTDILEDPSGKLWVSTTSGIDVIETGGIAQHLGRAEGLLNEWVSVLMLDRNGKLWAGTRGGLALMRDAPAGGRCGVERVYRDKNGLLNISALAQGPDGTIWMGTALGISRLQPYAANVRFQDFTRANGLTDRYIYSWPWTDSETSGRGLRAPE